MKNKEGSELAKYHTVANSSTKVKVIQMKLASVKKGEMGQRAKGNQQ